MSHIFSNECSFVFFGIANNQNTCLQETESSKEIEEHDKNSDRVTVWSAIHSEVVLHPYRFENETERKGDYSQLMYTRIIRSK